MLIRQKTEANSQRTKNTREQLEKDKKYQQQLSKESTLPSNMADVLNIWLRNNTFFSNEIEYIFKHTYIQGMHKCVPLTQSIFRAKY